MRSHSYRLKKRGWKVYEDNGAPKKESFASDGLACLVRFLIARIGKHGRAFYADELAGFGSFCRQDVINDAAVCAGCRLFPLYLPRIGQRGFHKRPIFLVR